MVSTLPDGTCRFRVYLPHAAKVELLGTFTDWRDRRIPMVREHPGWWEAIVAVENGEHQFSYLVDGAIWLADYAAHGVKLNSYGSWTSRLSIAKVDSASSRLPATAAA
jgi:1,4-alpha-glucan branching enzyme